MQAFLIAARHVVCFLLLELFLLSDVSVYFTNSACLLDHFCELQFRFFVFCKILLFYHYKPTATNFHKLLQTTKKAEKLCCIFPDFPLTLLQFAGGSLKQDNDNEREDFAIIK